MNINKQSISYKFMNESFWLKDESIPENLCPYMRRLVKGAVMSFISGIVMIFFVQAAIAAPFLFWFHLEGSLYLIMIQGVGLGVYLVLFIFGLSWAIQRAAKRLQPRTQRTIGAKVSAARESAANSLFEQWAKAVHDKVCPALTFGEPT